MTRIVCLTARLRAEYRRQMRLRERRQSLIVEHMWVAEKIARSLRHLFARQIPFEDLVQAGYVGLVEAAGRYEPAQGSFERYCYRRVRGAIVDSQKRQAYREESHESFEAIMEERGYLPAELQIDRHSPRPDELVLKRENMRLLRQRVDRLPDDERDVLLEALAGLKPSQSAAARGKPVAWARETLEAAKDKVAWKQAA